MGTLATGSLVAIQKANVAFLTGGTGAPGLVTNLIAKAYIDSIDSFLQTKSSSLATDWKKRLAHIRGDATTKLILQKAADSVQKYQPVAGAASGILASLDRLAYEIKSDAGNPVYVTPQTAVVAKTLSTSSAAIRSTFQDLIDKFDEFYQGTGAAATQTIVPKSGSTSNRIDRESLSTGSPQYWTYRIQGGSNTYGGMEMEAGVYFRGTDVRNALTTSLNSTVGPGPVGYTRLSAPLWLRNILNAADRLNG